MPSSSAAASPRAPAAELPGPFPVGVYAARLRGRLRDFAQVQLTGEVWGLRLSRARVYFELRDGTGALPCAIWRTDYEALGIAIADGMNVVVGGGCDLYPGSRTASPAFSFAVTELRVAGEGDLLAQLAIVRRRLADEGLLDRQAALPRPALPRTIGVICAETGKARDDVRAGLARRGWAGRLVWGFAPVQDRHAAPAVAATLRELAAMPPVEVTIVARGGGSLADLLAFCDESLCRTVALLRVPVIAAVGHHTDRTLLDDVAAVSCSTPTHAAEAAVPLDAPAARRALGAHAARLRAHGRHALLARAHALAALSRAPAAHLVRERSRLEGTMRQLQAGTRRTLSAHGAHTEAQARALARLGVRASGVDQAAHRRELERLALAVAGHDPARTTARGYAWVSDRTGTPLQGAAEAEAAGRLTLHFHDGELAVRAEEVPR